MCSSSNQKAERTPSFYKILLSNTNVDLDSRGDKLGRTDGRVATIRGHFFPSRWSLTIRKSFSSFFVNTSILYNGFHYYLHLSTFGYQYKKNNNTCKVRGNVLRGCVIHGVLKDVKISVYQETQSGGGLRCVTWRHTRRDDGSCNYTCPSGARTPETTSSLLHKTFMIIFQLHVYLTFGTKGRKIFPGNFEASSLTKQSTRQFPALRTCKYRKFSLMKTRHSAWQRTSQVMRRKVYNCWGKSIRFIERGKKSF